MIAVGFLGGPSPRVSFFPLPPESYRLFTVLVSLNDNVDWPQETLDKLKIKRYVFVFIISSSTSQFLPAKLKIQVQIQLGITKRDERLNFKYNSMFVSNIINLYLFQAI